MKNKYIYILLLILGTSFIISCEDFLEEEPKSFLTPETLFVDKQGAEIALMGLYKMLGDDKDHYSGLGLYSANFLTLDHGTSLTSSKTYSKDTDKGLDSYNVTPEDKYFKEIWEFSFAGIQRACVVIDRVNSMTDEQLPEVTKKQVVGEAKFIRALLNFNLVRLYGGIPVIDKELLDMSEENIKPSRDNIETVYDYIIEDLEYACENVFYRSGAPYLNSLGVENVGRATKASAYGLLSKVYLTLASTKRHASHIFNAARSTYADYSWVDEIAMYQKAAEYAAVVDTLPGTALLDDYAMVFMSENHSESLFEVQYIGDINGEGGMVAYTSGPNRPKTQKYEIDRGQRRVSPYPGLTDSYIKNWAVDSTLDKSASDFRYTWNIGTFEYRDDYGRDNFKTKGGFCYRKYRKTQVFQFLDDVNFRVLRYADVILMQAEALNELGRSDEAIVLINKIRARARNGSSYVYAPGPDPAYPASSEPADIGMGISQDSVFKLIKLERGWELCYEGLTRYDDLRWGQLEDEVKKQVVYTANTEGGDNKYFVDGRNLGGLPDTIPIEAAKNFKDKHWLFPIPSFEVDLNSNLEQNPGWF